VEDYKREELEGAVKAFKSSIGKCEKTKNKLKEGSWQRIFVESQLEAFYLAVSLVDGSRDGVKPRYTDAELDEAAATFKRLIDKCENTRIKLKDGSPQKTLADRRLRAFYIALAFIEEFKTS
jgi:hypothetical protein